MTDFIKYRFPGKAVELKTGRFQATEAAEVQRGVVFSTFDFSSCYVLLEQETEEKPELHFQTEKPYVMSAREYYLQAHELLNGLNLMQMEKAVFSRIKSQAFDASLSLELFDELCSSYPNAMVYLASGELFGTWIGASPEILMEVHQGFLFTTALAATHKTSEHPNLEWTEKEKIEQQIVTDYVLETCKSKKLKAIEIQGPYDYEAGPVTHIRTDISAELNGIKPWDMAQNLHPTPAVSGFPKKQSISLIHSVEPHQRQLYTGLVGIIGDEAAKLYVNLRCAQIQEHQLYLYLGGGYTPQSIPEMEWIETENKSKTIINCVQKISHENKF